MLDKLVHLWRQESRNVRLDDENKAIFLHIKNTNHSIAFQQASVMKYTNTYINRNLIESAVIKVFSDVLLTLYGPNSFFRRFSGHNLR